ncbi:MAG: helix-turn-helix domain-containing protein [Pseudomonadota bacterium]
MTRSVHQGFTERLELALEEAGYADYKQNQLGELFGVSGQAVRKWRRGESLPNAERAPHVAGKLGVRRAWLLDDEQPMRALHGAITEDGKDYSSKPGLSLSGEEFRLVTNLRQLPRKQQEDFNNLIAGIVAMQTTKKTDA